VAQRSPTTRLVHVRDDQPGINRRMTKLGFHYFGPNGRQIRNAAELRRIAALAVPPAWTDVWICPNRAGHIQATGRDARGRKQYRYHPRWRARRDRHKFERMLQFAAALPRIRARTRADLARPGLPMDKVLATVVQLLERSLIRVGNEEYARDNDSFGLTTLRNKHVAVRGSEVMFEFKGKSGIKHRVNVRDPRLARIVKQCRDLPGYELFQYVDEYGRRHSIGSADVNAYVRSIAGEEFSAKDFRTWAGTSLAVTALRTLLPCASAAEASRQTLKAIEAVAGTLGNSKAVCRSSYIHPRILAAYADGALSEAVQQRHGRRARRGTAGLKADEQLVVEILRRGKRAA
jgi:DNA topoisomerase-1